LNRDWVAEMQERSKRGDLHAIDGDLLPPVKPTEPLIPANDDIREDDEDPLSAVRGIVWVVPICVVGALLAALAIAYPW
jgi:hypothetical protein